jgi:deoxyribonuclease V
LSVGDRLNHSDPAAAPSRLPWCDPPDFAAARVAQAMLAQRVIRHDEHGPIRLIGGVDVSSTRFDPDRQVHAAIVVLSLPDLHPVARAAVTRRATLPYVPGYLGFREIPALLAAWHALDLKPDLLLVDGHGLAHPRGFGIATHLGVVLDLPSIGVAKSLLVGAPEAGLGDEVGATVPLIWKGEQLGTALRSRAGANPLYLAAGHRVSLESGVQWVRRCLTRYRLPEPTRLAHLAANAERQRARAG